jgi:hypothetical protein
LININNKKGKKPNVDREPQEIRKKYRFLYKENEDIDFAHDLGC